MGYTIQAIIGRRKQIETAAIEDATVILLAQELAMIPLGDKFRERYKIPFLPLTDEGWHSLPENIGELCSRLSMNGKIAYIEAEFFGGEGIQAYVLWQDGKMTGEVTISQTAINDAIHFLGAVPNPNLDHFDSVGLGTHRNTDDWLKS
ncbi:MAG: hypothetical protein HZB33_05010 [Nitrospirae bacterium]|nr:hypothetical protein [Nitrospirota bacterium]